MWNEWTIPSSDFGTAGVNAAAMKKMTSGVGQRGATTPGGKGMLFLDDIWIQKP